MDHSARAYHILSRIPGLRGQQTMLRSIRHFDTSNIAKERLKIILFFDTYGEKATKEAFGADRKVIARWRVRLQASRGKLSALIPHSTRPAHLRTSHIDPRIIAFIKQEREHHPRIGKEKLAPDVAEYCQSLGIASISASTIGRVIARHQFFFQKNTRPYHNANGKWATSQRRKKRLRIRHSPKPTRYGHIVADTVVRVTDGIKDYFMSAIDAKMKFALTIRYKRNTATNMADFYQQFKTVYPATIRIWQSDNGSENLGVFDTQLEKDHIPHLFIYPRCPKIDTFIERYNRTLQEEFIDEHLDTMHDLVVFGQQLAEWNIYYNTKRRHHSLGLKSPLQYLLDNNEMSQMCWTYTTT